MKTFVSTYIFGFCYKPLESEVLSKETEAKIMGLIGFLNSLKNIAKLVNEKPKKLYDAIVELYEPFCPKQEAMKLAAYFLAENPLIQGPKLTEAIGGEEDKFVELRSAYMQILDFKDREVLPAIRRVFWGFFMAGETQVINRIIADFSAEYMVQNPVASELTQTSPYLNGDNVWMFIACILLLNTDMTKKGLKEKMTLEGFFKNVNRALPTCPPSDEIVTEM
jgi:Sec7-like guanine-nucleotide exchange factor